jgi:hypothetical protein
MTKILIKVQDMAKEDGLEEDMWDFSMDINVPMQNPARNVAAGFDGQTQG